MGTCRRPVGLVRLMGGGEGVSFKRGRCCCRTSLSGCLPNTSSLAASYNSEKSVPRSNQPAMLSKRVNQEQIFFCLPKRVLLKNCAF